MHATDEPWPPSYSGGAIQMTDVPAQPMLVCFDFEKPVAEIIYVGLTTYRKSSQLPTTATDLLAQGLTPEGLEGTKLCDALQRGHVQEVSDMLTKGTNINSTDALVCALYGSWPIDKLEILLSAKANPNAIPYASQEGPLYYAVKRCDTDGDAKCAAAVTQLLAAGANPNFIGVLGQTPAHRVANAKYPLAYKAMVAGGGDISLADDNGKTPARLFEESRRR